MSQFEPRPFGKYFLTDRIAVGGMAEIYKAKTFGVDGFEKTLAIKKILANYSADKEFVTMLTDEAKLVVNLSHPNIVQIYDLGRVGDDYFISMEFIDGVNLRELINRVSEINQKIPIDICLYIAAEICKGLDYAHSKRGSDGKPLEIVHRDVSPHNILVSFEGEVKIVDFGIAKAAQNVSQTQMGTLKGKVTYMSPEQASGKPFDQRTDIFSCGILLYEMLSFERLFTGDTQIEVLNLIRNTKITEASLKSKIPEAALKVVAKALAHHPRDRYQTAADMQVEITRLLYSRFNEFSPRKLSELLKNWYGRAAQSKANHEILPPYETKSILMNSQEQVNIVHRESKDDTGIVDTLRAGETKVDDFQNVDDATQNGRTEKLDMASVVISPQHVRRYALISVLTLLALMTSYLVFDYFRHLKPVDSGQISVEKTEVELKSHPQGATVYLNGKDTGLKTPATLSGLTLKRDYEMTLVKEGFETLETTLRLDSPDPQPLAFSLKKIIPVSYTLTVKSSPEGAEVLLDDVATGKTTPAEFIGLKIAQEYRIKLKKDGYEDYKASFKNENPKDQIVDVSLSEAKLAVLVIDSEPQGATILFDGIDTGFVTPHEFPDLKTPQVVKLTVAKDGFVAATETVGLTDESEKQVRMTLKPLEVKYVLKISSMPKGAKIKLNGKDSGALPLNLSVPAGKYEVEAVLDGYKTQMRTIEVSDGDRDVTFTLTPVKIPSTKAVTTPTLPIQTNTTKVVTPTPQPLTTTSSSSKAATARLRVDSTPRGASVTVNGSPRGITPIVIMDLPKLKNLTIVVAKKGYKSWQQTLSLAKDYAELSAKLAPN